MRMRIIEPLVIFFICKIIYCLQVIPERCNLTYQNSKYLEKSQFYVKRHGRKSGYYINIEGGNKHEWNNNVTINFVFNEFLHNEYRRSFVEFRYKFCDFLSLDAYIGKMVAKHGLTCPLPVNHYHLMNMTAPTDNFPNVFPFEKGRIDIELSITRTEESIARAYLYAVFKNKKKN